MVATQNKTIRALPLLSATLLLVVAGCLKPSGGRRQALTGIDLNGDSTTVATTPALEGPDNTVQQARRLTNAEYDATTAALIGADLGLGLSFIADEQVIGYRNNLTTTVTLPHTQQYETAALKLAAAASIATLAPCSTVTPLAPDCAASFVKSFGRRAYRRPLSATETARFLALFTSDAFPSFEEAARQVLVTMLQSPNFLYVFENGNGTPSATGLQPLTPFELATRLSFLIWDTGPDDTLLDAAAEGRLETDADLDREVDRLLDAPRAHTGFRTFYQQWLGLDSLASAAKNPTAFPQFTSLRASMKMETTTFVDEIVWHRHGRLSTLLEAPYTYADPALAAFYGLTPASGEGPALYDTTEIGRRGLLTQASLLAINSHPDLTSPVLRGKFIREKLLCDEIAQPPANVMTAVPEAGATQSTRDAFSAHANAPECAGCHQRMDPIGMGFEGFDATGAIRTVDGGQPVVASGALKLTKATDAIFTGAVELAGILANSTEVRDCVATQWFRYAAGRAQVTRDDGSVTRLTEAFAESNGTFQSLFHAYVHTDSFKNKLVTPPTEDASP